MSGTSFISAQPQQEPFPDVFGNFLKARDNALAYRTNTFNLDASQQKQAQEQQINALAPRILAGDQAAYEQAIAIDPVRTQAIRSGNQEYDIRGAANARADVASGLAVNRDQRDLESHISTMSDAQRRRAEENIGIMARIGGSLMTTYPDTASRATAWPAARADIKRLTGNDPGEAYPGDARVQQFLLQAQSAQDLFKNSTTGIGAAPPGFYGGAATTAPASVPIPSGGTPLPAPPAQTVAPQPTTPPNALQPRPQATAPAPAQSPQVAQLQSMADEIAARNQVPPRLFRSMIGAESNWNPNAVSRAGAKGLGQLMDGTAAGLGVRDVLNPTDNMTGSATYVRQLMDQFGNIPDAVAAYNAGPGRVAGWIRAGRPAGGLPNETTAYVAKVLANAGGVSDHAPVGGNVGRAAIMPGGGFNDAGMGSGPGAMVPDPGYVGTGAPSQPTAPVQQPQPAPVQAPAPLPAALVGDGPLAQAANATAAPPRPSVSGLPEGYEYAMTPQGQFYTHGAPAGKVWAWRPGDPISKTVVDLPGAKSTEERKVAFDQADKLRDEWNKATAPFVLTQNAYNTMQRAQENPSAAGDLSMIFGFMKMLDPTSTVREGEAASVQNAGGISDRVRNVYNSILSGERLTEEQRKDLVSQSENLFKVSQKHYDNTKEQYGSLADHFGVPRKAVLVEHARPQTAGQGGPSPAQLPIMATPADAMKLPPGTRFLDANGVERMRP